MGMFNSGANKAAEEARKQAEQQKAQFEAEQTAMRESNYLSSQQAMDSVTRVEAGGSATQADQAGMGFSTKKKKQAQGVSSSLGI